MELVYLRIGFPTCGCAIAPSALLLARARPPTGPGDLADACAGWLLQGDALVQQWHIILGGASAH